MPVFAQQYRTANRTSSLAPQPEQPAQQCVHSAQRRRQTYGNQAVQRLLQARVIQAKLSVSQPGDPYEQEADRVADEVMRMPDPLPTENPAVTRAALPPSIQRLCSECEEELQRQVEPPTIQRRCSACEAELELEQRDVVDEEIHVQAKEVPGRVPEATPGVARTIRSLEGRGQPLSAATRSFFEPRFGVDFSGVRVHMDSNAIRLAQEVNANAFTVGRNIVFAAGRFAPATEEGRKLVAHELVHIVQQSDGSWNNTPTVLQRQHTPAAHRRPSRSRASARAEHAAHQAFAQLEARDRTAAQLLDELDRSFSVLAIRIEDLIDAYADEGVRGSEAVEIYERWVRNAGRRREQMISGTPPFSPRRIFLWVVAIRNALHGQHRIMRAFREEVPDDQGYLEVVQLRTQAANLAFEVSSLPIVQAGRGESTQQQEAETPSTGSDVRREHIRSATEYIWRYARRHQTGSPSLLATGLIEGLVSRDLSREEIRIALSQLEAHDEATYRRALYEGHTLSLLNERIFEVRQRGDEDSDPTVTLIEWFREYVAENRSALRSTPRRFRAAIFAEEIMRRFGSDRSRIDSFFEDLESRDSELYAVVWAEGETRRQVLFHVVESRLAQGEAGIIESTGRVVVHALMGSFYEPEPAHEVGESEGFEAELRAEERALEDTTSIALDTGITLIPILDQLGDLRDISAELIYMLNLDDEHEDYHRDSLNWLSFVGTLIGFVPEAGSLFRGFTRLVAAGMRRAGRGVRAVVTAIAEPAMRLLRRVSPRIEERVVEALDLVRHRWDVVVRRVSWHWDDVVEAVEGGLNLAGQFFRRRVRRIRARWRLFQRMAGQRIPESLRLIPPYLARMFGDIMAGLRGAARRVGQALEPLVTPVVERLSRVRDRIRSFSATGRLEMLDESFERLQDVEERLLRAAREGDEQLVRRLAEEAEAVAAQAERRLGLVEPVSPTQPRPAASGRASQAGATSPQATPASPHMAPPHPASSRVDERLVGDVEPRDAGTTVRQAPSESTTLPAAERRAGRADRQLETSGRRTVGVQGRRLTMCRNPCDSLVDKLRAMADVLPEGHTARVDLELLVRQGTRIEQQLGAGIITPQASQAMVARIAHNLEEMQHAMPELRQLTALDLDVLRAEHVSLRDQIVESLSRRSEVEIDAEFGPEVELETVFGSLTEELELPPQPQLSGQFPGLETRESVRLAREHGWIDEHGQPVGLLDPEAERHVRIEAATQPHRRAGDVRAELRVTGRELESAHGAATTFVRRLNDYSRELANTFLLPPSTHHLFDSHWKNWARRQRQLMETFGQADFRVPLGDVLAAHRNAVRELLNLSPTRRAQMEAMISDEFLRLAAGLDDGLDTLVPLPDPDAWIRRRRRRRRR